MLRDWDSTVQRIADLEGTVKALTSENRLLVDGLSGMAGELARMREDLRKPDPEAQPAVRRRTVPFREFAAAARVAGKKE